MKITNIIIIIVIIIILIIITTTATTTTRKSTHHGRLVLGVGLKAHSWLCHTAVRYRPFVSVPLHVRTYKLSFVLGEGVRWRGGWA